jgi:hypothetical protein
MAVKWIRGEFGELHRFLMVDEDGDVVGSCGLNSERAAHVTVEAIVGDEWIGARGAL